MKRKIILFAVLLLILIVLILIFAGNTSNNSQDSNKIRVVASFYPVYDFTKNVGGNRINVTSLIPVGVEPHDFEPTPQDIIDLSFANVFVLNGVIETPWANVLIQGIDNNNLIVVDTSKDINLVGSMDADISGNDPHIWLDPVLAKKQVIAIRDALIQADPQGKYYYEDNADIYLKKLDALDNEFRITFSTCKKKDILITHATLAYFCKEYGCNQVPVEGVNAEGDPSPAVLADIIKQAKDKNITTAFVENLMNPKSAQTIAEEIHGKAVVFNSVHGLTIEEEQRGEDYISQMQENIEIIKTSLDCN